MRSTRWMLTLAASAALLAPAAARAQAATDFCAATTPAGLNPTCNRTKDVTATIGNILYLGIIPQGAGAGINLQATDTAAFEKTYRANGNANGTTGTAVATALTLQSAAAPDSVVVRANRGYALTLQATTDLFKFDKDFDYNTCRSTPASTTGCLASEALAGKPVGDLYWATAAAGSFAQVIGSSGSATTIHSSPTSGERYGTEIYFKSAWFYATDIPGKYTATVRYTVTGQ